MKRAKRRTITAAFNRLLEPFDQGLDGLLQAAVDIGMLITPDRRQRLYLLAWRLAEAGIEFNDANDAAATFGSVLCATAEDQGRFEVELRKLWRKVSASAVNSDYERKRPPDLPPGKIAKALALLSARPLVIPALVAAIVITLGLAIWYVAARSGIEYPGSNPNKGDANPFSGSIDLLEAAAFDLFQRAIVALPAAIAAWLAWTWWRPPIYSISREQGSAERLERFTRAHLNILFRGTTARLAFDTLRRAVRTQSSRVDVLSSLRATVRAAGWPSIRHATYRNSLEVVLFVDREGAADHLAFLAHLLEDRLRAAGATVTRYDFRLTPIRLTQVSGRPDGATVEDVERIVARHVGQRLILIGDGYGLVEGDDLDDELRLRRLLGEFAQVLILTPTPEDYWDERERRLLLAGFNLALCDRDGIEDTARVSTLVDWTEWLAISLMNIRRDPDPFLAHLEYEYHRYAVDYPVLQTPTGAPDGPIATVGLNALQIRSLVSSLQAWMGSRPAFRLLVAIALFPSVRPEYTLAIADALGRDNEAPGAALDEKLYARLARLPWLRDGRFPDWLRLALARRLTESEREAMARAHIKLLAPMVLAHGTIVAQASLEIGRKSLRANMDPNHPLAERLFLAMLFGLSPKADLLRPKATSAITKALGGQRKRAPRIVAAVFVLAGALCFLFKDSVVFPALIAAEAWFTTVIAPFLPQGRPAAIARYLAIAFATVALFWPKRPIKNTATVEPTIVGMLYQLPGTSWALRMVLSVVGAVFATTGLWDDDRFAGDFASAVGILSVVALASVLFERHPASHGDFFIIPDIDGATIKGDAPISQYTLGKIIASREVIAPSLATGGILLIPVFLLVFWTLVFVIRPKYSTGTVSVLIFGSGWTIVAMSLRRVMLGSWLLGTSDGVNRHLLIDFLSGATAGSILLVSNQFRDGNDTILLTSMVSAFFYFGIDALGLHPRTVPTLHGDQVRANIALAFLTTTLAITGMVFMSLALPGDTVPFLAAALPVAFILQFAASVALVPIAGITISLRERFDVTIRHIFSEKRFLLQSLSISLLAPLLYLITIYFGTSASPAAMLPIALLSSLSAWSMFRVFGAVSLIEGLKARQSEAPAIAEPAPLWSLFDTPWWATIVLLTLLLPRWPALQSILSPDDAAGISANLLFAAPPICVAFAHRYGSAALWPVALGLLPQVVAAPGADYILRGTPGFVAVTLFWTRFVADPRLRCSLLTCETLPLLDLIILAVAFAFTLTIILPGQLELQYDPGWLVLTVAFVIGLTRIPPWSFLILLGLLAICRQGFDLSSIVHAAAGGGAGAALRPNVAAPAAVTLEYGLPSTTALGAILVTLLTRTYLRKAMTVDAQRSLEPSSTRALSIGALRSSMIRTFSSARLPIVLFAMFEVGWIVASAEEVTHLEPLFDSIVRNPVVAATGLMLGLSVVYWLDLVALLAAVLGTAAFVGFINSSFAIGLSSALDVADSKTTFFVSYGYVGYVLFGFAIRMFAEGRWTISDFFFDISRPLLKIIRPLATSAPKASLQSAFESTVEKPVAREPNRPVEQHESDLVSNPPPPKKSKKALNKTSKQKARKPSKK